MTNIELIQTLNQQKHLIFEQWTQLIGTFTEREQAYAADLAREISLARFGNKIFFRGIIEFTNYCKNDCLYCGIRRSSGASRYRLSKEDILLSCEDGYRAGFRTFVLQGGEDPWFSDERMEEIVRAIREGYPDCAITLSLGERSRESYQRLFDAGADRYLLRHETADKQHYESLHPPEISFENRMRCLYDLRDIGYQTGCGMMVGTPGQRPEHLASDMLFMCGFRPQMIGTGPFLPHHDTPFRNEPAGSADVTLMLMSLCRIMLPDVLLPATTALGTLDGEGRKRGVLAGANVIMPNLSPLAVREKYMLYDGKSISGDDAGESLDILRRHMQEIGYELQVGRGDYKEGTDK